jgi:RHS repeat-associated protein
MTDEEGRIVWWGTYKAFGSCWAKEGCSIENNLRLPGQYYDVESGLHYNCFRYYDPIVGRYISQDPIGYAAGDFNLYRYCGNDPVNAFDPTGEAIPLAVLGIAFLVHTIGGAITGAAGGMISGGIVGAANSVSDNRRCWCDGVWGGMKHGFVVGASVGAVVGPVGGFSAGSIVSGFSNALVGDLTDPRVLSHHPGWDPHCP